MKFNEKQKAIILREQGYSLSEISALLGVAKSSASLWVRKVPLSVMAKKRLLSVIKKAQYVSGEKKKSATKVFNDSILQDTQRWIGGVKVSTDAEKLICAMIYWCEGAKDYRNGVAFTNSDPNLTRLFLDLLEKEFKINRNKIVVRLHLHEYHNPSVQTSFWMKALNVSRSQFRKHYLKPHTGKRTRDNYPGCISLRYYDSILARKLMAIAKVYTEMGV